jgi:hypothetical protein
VATGNPDRRALDPAAPPQYDDRIRRLAAGSTARSEAADATGKPKTGNRIPATGNGKRATGNGLPASGQ